VSQLAPRGTGEGREQLPPQWRRWEGVKQSFQNTIYM